MAVEIWFCANRTERMTFKEDARIEEISRKYMEEYKGTEFEGPGCIKGEEGEPVFAGDIRIPFYSPELEDELEEFLDYWLKWLTEITSVLVGAEWEVSVEDVPLLWDKESGWRLMTDEEYGELIEKGD